MNLKSHVPNFITTLNLVCGVISITETMDGNLVWAALFIFLAGIFDYLDGTAARVLNARSPIGKQLDSLADVVSFGVAPGLIMYRLLLIQCEQGCNILEKFHIIPYFALLIPVFSALRLAKFNIDPGQEENFSGLPTPANAIFFASIPLILFIPGNEMSLFTIPHLATFLSGVKVLGILTVCFSFLLVSDFRIFSMKFKNMKLKENQPRYILFVISFFLIVMFSFQAIPFILITYLLLSLVYQKTIS